MKKRNWEILAPDPKRHQEPFYDLICKVFSSGDFGFFEGRRECRRVIGGGHSHLDWDVSRIAMIGDRLVADYSVWDYQMRIGRARLRVGGIGCVATHGDFRKRGIQADTARASIEAMRRAGYDMTILFGIPDFYRRFGYARAWSESSYEVPVTELRPGAVAPALKRFDVARDAESHRLYNRTHARLTGTAVRPTYRRSWADTPYRSWRWADVRGRMLGYVRCRPRQGEKVLSCCEVAGDTDTALAAVAKLARRDGSHRVRFASIPFDHPLAVRLRRGTCDMEIKYRRCGSAMARTLNLAGCLHKMGGELSARLKASPYAGWRGHLAIRDRREHVVLAIDRGRVRVSGPRTTAHAIRGGEEVVQLLLGTDEPLEIAAAARMRLTGDARGLVPVLFPHQHPMLSAFDRY